jgi:two-component system OmpR family response regulator
MAQRILVIEDDPSIGALLAAQLSAPGVEVRLERDGEHGLACAAPGKWALYIVDRMLPGIDGIRVCRRLRAMGMATPIILLTAKDSEQDRVDGLDAGADDYIAKPFSMRELQARVRAQLRRPFTAGLTGDTASAYAPPLRVGTLRVDPGSRAVERDGQPLALTAKEFQLLYHLMCHTDRAWSREQLLNRIWGPGYDGYAHTVNSHINRLRAKLEVDPAHPQWIVTVWGTGYRFATESAH